VTAVIENPDIKITERLVEVHPYEKLLAEKGRCAGAKWWFKDSVSNGYRMARCIDCPVVAECRVVIDHIEENSPSMDKGLVPDRLTGFWAGETPRQRAFRRRATLVTAS
jgi:hypothetical protein